MLYCKNVGYDMTLRSTTNTITMMISSNSNKC